MGHLGFRFTQHFDGLLGIGHDRRQQVGRSGEPGELDALGVLWAEEENERRALQLSEVHRRVCERRRQFGEPEPALRALAEQATKTVEEQKAFVLSKWALLAFRIVGGLAALAIGLVLLLGGYSEKPLSLRYFVGAEVTIGAVRGRKSGSMRGISAVPRRN